MAKKQSLMTWKIGLDVQFIKTETAVGVWGAGGETHQAFLTVCWRKAERSSGNLRKIREKEEFSDAVFQSWR